MWNVEYSQQKKILNENKLDQKTLINNIIFCKYLLISLDILKSLDYIGYFLDILMSFFWIILLE